MNDIFIKEQYTDKLNMNNMSESMRKNMVQQTIKNKYLILKPKPNQIYKICAETKWDKVAAENLIEDRLNKLNQNTPQLRYWWIMAECVSIYNQTHNNQSSKPHPIYKNLELMPTNTCLRASALANNHHVANCRP